MKKYCKQAFKEKFSYLANIFVFYFNHLIEKIVKKNNIML